jgi:2-oxo-3-hexenedioate decarboxylase
MSAALAEDTADRLARELLLAREAVACLPRLTERHAGLGLADAFAIADRTVRLRQDGGERIAGWKIGFTNRSIWDRYGVHAPIWAPVWASTLTLLDKPQGTADLTPYCQPRLEPEVVFGFARTPRPGATLDERVDDLAWVALGFEVVHTHFDGWRFAAPDTVADFGLHGGLWVGPRQPLAAVAGDATGAGRGTRLADALSGLALTLAQGERDVDQGRGAVVLDGPLQALNTWIDAMAATTPHWRIEPGHVVTTGTITDAAPIAPGQMWHACTDHPALAGLSLATCR